MAEMKANKLVVEAQVEPTPASGGTLSPAMEPTPAVAEAPNQGVLAVAVPVNPLLGVEKLAPLEEAPHAMAAKDPSMQLEETPKI